MIAHTQKKLVLSEIGEGDKRVQPSNYYIFSHMNGSIA